MSFSLHTFVVCSPCVFTAAMWMNNRALFPTAEFGNLSSWQCSVSTQEGATVLISSDQSAVSPPEGAPIPLASERSGGSTPREGSTVPLWCDEFVASTPGCASNALSAAQLRASKAEDNGKLCRYKCRNWLGFFQMCEIGQICEIG
jgi:hypothetical protein